MADTYTVITEFLKAMRKIMAGRRVHITDVDYSYPIVFENGVKIHIFLGSDHRLAKDSLHTARLLLNAHSGGFLMNYVWNAGDGLHDRLVMEFMKEHAFVRDTAPDTNVMSDAEVLALLMDVPTLGITIKGHMNQYPDVWNGISV